MFSSNQEFKVSCTDEQLKDVLNLVFQMKDSNCDYCYQILEDGTFALGAIYGSNPAKGWLEFPYKKPSINLLVETIKQCIKDNRLKNSEYKKEYNEYDFYCDGSTELGYLVETIPEIFSNEWQGIKSPFYGIVKIRPFCVFYSK